MNRYLILGALATGIAASAPTLLGKFSGNDRLAGRTAEPPLADSISATERRENPLSGRIARIERDKRGHFVATAKLNGRPVEVLVDTGATLVAINETTARRLGIKLTAADFKYRVRTANGMAEAAAATIEEIQIGRVIVRDVQASVSRDAALSATLLGMSFLNKLKKFEIDAGDLVLSQ